MILERPFDEWMERWKDGNPRKVTWTNPAAPGTSVVLRARSRIGTEVNYALLARSNDPRYQNCEAFARWCHWKMSRSTQAVLALKFLASVVVVVLVIGWICGIWGVTYPLGFIVSFPVTYPLVFPLMVGVLNKVLQPTVGSTST